MSSCTDVLMLRSCLSSEARLNNLWRARERSDRKDMGALCVFKHRVCTVDRFAKKARYIQGTYMGW